MAQPTFRRLWIKVLPNGSALPQFEPATGKDHGCGEYVGPVAQIHFYPITESLAEKIRARGDKAEASRLPGLSFDILPGSDVEFNRVGALRIDYEKGCNFCGCEFDPSLRQCPRCLAQVEWYCSKCDELKPVPIIDFLITNKLGMVKIVKIPPALYEFAEQVIDNIGYGEWVLSDFQARCPECEKTDPRGVRRIKCIEPTAEERLFTHYHLKINGQKHLIMDYKVRMRA
jgi:hypothetical protein